MRACKARETSQKTWENPKLFGTGKIGFWRERNPARIGIKAGERGDHQVQKYIEKMQGICEVRVTVVGIERQSAKGACDAEPKSQVDEERHHVGSRSQTCFGD